MTSDRDIMATALLCIKQHGESAGYYARGRMETLRDEGAHTGAATWAKVAALCEKWERAEPKTGEGLN